jgi:hypothetical protein
VVGVVGRRVVGGVAGVVLLVEVTGSGGATRCQLGT